MLLSRSTQGYQPRRRPKGCCGSARRQLRESRTSQARETTALAAGWQPNDRGPYSVQAGSKWPVGQ